MNEELPVITPARKRLVMGNEEEIVPVGLVSPAEVIKRARSGVVKPEMIDTETIGIRVPHISVFPREQHLLDHMTKLVSLRTQHKRVLEIIDEEIAHSVNVLEGLTVRGLVDVLSVRKNFSNVLVEISRADTEIIGLFEPIIREARREYASAYNTAHSALEKVVNYK